MDCGLAGAGIVLDDRPEIWAGVTVDVTEAEGPGVAWSLVDPGCCLEPALGVVACTGGDVDLGLAGARAASGYEPHVWLTVDVLVSDQM